MFFINHSLYTLSLSVYKKSLQPHFSNYICNSDSPCREGLWSPTGKLPYICQWPNLTTNKQNEQPCAADFVTYERCSHFSRRWFTKLIYLIQFWTHHRRDGWLSLLPSDQFLTVPLLRMAEINGDIKLTITLFLFFRFCVGWSFSLGSSCSYVQNY